MKSSVRPLIRETIALTIRDIRECRANRSVTAILGAGFTIATKGGTSALSLVEVPEKGKIGYNFSASWNRRSVYYTKGKAKQILASIAPDRPEMELEVIHMHDLRDRQEAVATSLLRAMVARRNA